MPAKIYEAGLNQRIVLIEFDDIAKATAAHDVPDFQAATCTPRGSNCLWPCGSRLSTCRGQGAKEERND